MKFLALCSRLGMVSKRTTLAMIRNDGASTSLGLRA